jgi:hypothetical protein
MRLALALVLASLAASAVLAGSPVWTAQQPLLVSVGPDSAIGGFVVPGDEQDLRIHPTRAPRYVIEPPRLPGLDVGRFHAALGAGGEQQFNLGTCHLDTQDFWSSSLSGRIDGRGARFTFTIPIQ